MCDNDQDLIYLPGRTETHEEWLKRRMKESNKEYEEHKQRLKVKKHFEDISKALVRQLEKNNISDKKVTVDNFFKSTIGTFDEIKEIPEGFTCIFNSKTSKYYTNESKDKVVRVSDHWGWGIRFCVWFLRGYPQESAKKWIKNHGSEMKIGIIEIRHLRIHKKLQKKAIEWYNKRDQNEGN